MDRPTCSVPGCDHPDGASWRYAGLGDFCTFHGKLIATFNRELETDAFVDELDRLGRLDSIRQRNLDRRSRG